MIVLVQTSQIMKVIFYSLLATILLSSATCKKVQPDTNLEKQLIGIWKYTGKSGGYAGKSEKADPAISQTLEFKSGRHYTRKMNDKITEEGLYELYKTKSIYSGKEDNAIRFGTDSNHLSRNSIISLQKDSLTIADNVYDGFKTAYIRIK